MAVETVTEVASGIDTTKISDEIIKVLDAIGGKMGTAINWSQENIVPYIMDLVHRFVTYRITMEIITICFCMCFIVTGIVIIKKTMTKWYPKWVKDWDGDGEAEVALATVIYILSGIAILIGFITLCFSISDLTQWIFVPEYALFKEFSSLLNSPVA